MNYNYFSRKALILLAGSALLASCAEMPSANPAIGVRVNIQDTKAATTTTSSLEVYGKFAMEAYMDDEWNEYDEDGTVINSGSAGLYFSSEGNANVLNKSGVWTITPEQKWIANDLTRFKCYAPVEVNGTREFSNMTFGGAYAKTDTISFSYTMKEGGQLSGGKPADADCCDDIIFAYAEKNYSKSSSSFIDLTFQHAMSKICFCVSPDDATFDTGLMIEDITVKGVVTSGSCIFDGGGSIDAGTMFTWTPGSTTDDYAQTYDAKFKTKPAGWTEGTFVQDSHTYHKYTCDNAFFFVPHTTDEVKLVIAFNDNGDRTVRTVTLPDTVWMPGKYYCYKIAATTLGRTIKVTVSLDEWDNYDDKLFI